MLEEIDLNVFGPDEPSLTIAVIGAGPRGISVLERLAVQLRHHPSGRVRIHLIDAVEVGAGRVWRTDQQDWFTMNTVAGQVTMFSGDADGGPARPGAGPALDQWLGVDPNEYVSRLDYGRYLRFVYETIAAELTDLVPMRASVTAVQPRASGGYRLTFDARPDLDVDKVVLTTGHPRNEPDKAEQLLLDFADRHPGTRYLCGDSAADLDLSQGTVPAGSTVGIRGMGLSFYDVMLTLTIGRGGVFERTSGGLRYRPGGAEPLIVTGSRSGLPIPARGRNQKPREWTHRAIFLTREALRAARRRRKNSTGSDRLDFDTDVLPLLLNEVEHVFYTTHVRTRRGTRAAEQFATAHIAALESGVDTADLFAASGLADLPPLDLGALARPFAAEWFPDPARWRRRLLEHMRHDLAEAELGNLDGPLKAALDVLRDIRAMVREAVDFGGLTPRSHRDDFLGRYVPVNALLSAGPPQERVEQLVALIEAGVVDVVGPAVEFEPDETSGRFGAHSPMVGGSRRHVDVLVDARIPAPCLRRDTSPLTRQLVADRLVAEYVTVDERSHEVFRTGGLEVTPAPFHVVDADGVVRPNLYALGIPTEYTRWFTQVGSSRPCTDTSFYHDADAIATDLCRPLRIRHRLATVHSGGSR